MPEFNNPSLAEQRRRHTASHVMSAAVKMLFPQALRGVGPWTNEGFYQDFDFLSESISVTDLKKIEKKMRWVVNKNFSLQTSEISLSNAKKAFSHDKYKLELIAELSQNKQTLKVCDFLSADGQIFYRDLCGGSHLSSTGELGTYQLTHLAAAYWRGDEQRESLTRIYGVAFANEAQLQDYQQRKAEQLKRDHRKIGQELGIFAFSEEVGPGLALWLPNGTIMIQQLEKLARRMEDKYGYQQVRTPHIAKGSLYAKTGHLQLYQESMFPPLSMDGEDYYLKSMNCPHHHRIFSATPKSYRDLPLRLAEYGTVYRHEDSGSLFGLMRVRGMCMNDAHIYCTEEQFAIEFGRVIDMYLFYFKLFGLQKFTMRLSKHDPSKFGKKYVNEPALWQKTEQQVREVLQKANIPFIEADDEAAFYGPKIDVQVWSAIGREFSLATNQLDFDVPSKLGLYYTDKNGDKKTPLCIHRAPLSTHERLIGFLLEHYAGNLPVWLAPVQAVILPVAKSHHDTAQKLQFTLNQDGGRVQYFDSRDSLNKRIRQAELKKVPLIIVIGDQEVASQNYSLRLHGENQTKTVDYQYLKAELTREIEIPN